MTSLISKFLALGGSLKDIGSWSFFGFAGASASSIISNYSASASMITSTCLELDNLILLFIFDGVAS
jgi:hypothetical protein